MTWNDIKRKLTSRKLWMAIGSFISLLLAALGMHEQQIAQIVALVGAGATVISYIIGEGMIDAANAGAPTYVIGYTPEAGEESTDTDIDEDPDSEVQEDTDPPPEV